MATKTTDKIKKEMVNQKDIFKIYMADIDILFKIYIY